MMESASDAIADGALSWRAEGGKDRNNENNVILGAKKNIYFIEQTHARDSRGRRRLGGRAREADA